MFSELETQINALLLAMIIYSTAQSSRRTLFTITLVTDNSTKLDTTKLILQSENHIQRYLRGIKVMVKPSTYQAEEDDEAGDVTEHPPEGDL